MRFSNGLCQVALALGLMILPVFAFADERPTEEIGYCNALTLQVENDEIAATDRHYSSGVRLVCAGAMPELVKSPLSTFVPDDRRARYAASYGLGQNIYTPDDLDQTELIEDDQPYAGWLYLDFGFETEVSSASGDILYLDKFGLQLGVVGPLAGGEAAQNYIHDLVGASEAAGWDKQLDNEPGVNFFYERQWTGLGRYRLRDERGLAGPVVDITPKLGAALGNIHIHGATGLTLRIGHFPPDDHGPPAIRPSFSGSDSLPRGSGWSAYLFGGVEGRLVARNIFLDGNSFDDDSPSVDKNDLVGEGRLGLAASYGCFRATYTYVFRSQEFKDQEPQTYGAAALSIAW